MKEFRYRIEKTVDGSTYAEFSNGRFFTVDALMEVLKEMTRIDEDSRIISYESS